MDNSPVDDGVRVRLELPSVATSVGLIRSVIRAVARSAGVDETLVDDMRTALSEACNNVVLHAYPAGPGPLIFSLAVRDAYIEAVVRDHGGGIRPGPGRNRGLGMGVALVNSIADRAEFQSSELGTEVRMRFLRLAKETAGTAGGVSLGVWALTDPRSSDALQARSD